MCSTILDFCIFSLYLNILYLYICYVAIDEHWRRLFCDIVNISENCIFIFFWDLNFFKLSQMRLFWLISLDLMEGFVSDFCQTSL